MIKSALSASEEARTLHSDHGRAHAALNGKTVVFVGPGGLSKYHHYCDVRSWGLKVVILQSPRDNVPKECADRIITIPDLFDHSRDEELEINIVSALRSADIDPDGILTLWEDCGPLTARLAANFKLPGVSPQAARIAKSKFETQKLLCSASGRSGHPLGSKCFRCKTPDDIRIAIEQVGTPALLKLEYGSSAVGVVAVETLDAALKVSDQIRQALQTETDCPGVGLGFGSSVIVTELLSGREFDVDLIVSRGKLVAAFVTDNSPTREESFSECMAWMPSKIRQDEQQTLIQAAFETCRMIGLSNGSFNVELIFTELGPKVIDVNARMGGFYIRDWISRVWNYDILLANIHCALGMDPPPSAAPTGAIIGAMILPSKHGKWLSDPSNIERFLGEAKSSDILVNVFSDRIVHAAFADRPWGSIGAFGADRAEATGKLLQAWARVGLSQHDPDIESFS